MKKLIILFILFFTFSVTVPVHGEEQAYEKVIALDIDNNIMKDGYGFITYNSILDRYIFNYEKYGDEVIKDYNGERSFGYSTVIKPIFPQLMQDELDMDKSIIIDIVAIKDGLWSKAERQITEYVTTFTCRSISKYNDGGFVSWTEIFVIGSFDTRVDEVKYANFHIKGNYYNKPFWPWNPMVKGDQYNYDVKVLKNQFQNYDHAPKLALSEYGYFFRNFFILDSPDFDAITKDEVTDEFIFRTGFIDGLYVPNNVILVDVMYVAEDVLIYTNFVQTLYEGNTVILTPKAGFPALFGNGINPFSWIINNFKTIIWITITVILIIICWPLIKLVFNLIANLFKRINAQRKERKSQRMRN